MQRPPINTDGIQGCARRLAKHNPLPRSPRGAQIGNGKDELTARPKHATTVAQQRTGIDDELQDAHRRHGIERGVRKRQRLNPGIADECVDPSSPGLLDCTRGEIDAVNLYEAARNRLREVTGTAANIEKSVATREKRQRLLRADVAANSEISSAALLASLPDIFEMPAAISAHAAAPHTRSKMRDSVR